jgi:hypothetical protein
MGLGGGAVVDELREIRNSNLESNSKFELRRRLEKFLGYLSKSHRLIDLPRPPDLFEFDVLRHGVCTGIVAHECPLCGLPVSSEVKVPGLQMVGMGWLMGPAPIRDQGEMREGR